MPFKIEYLCGTDLPKLAWCLEFTRTSHAIRVFHGPWVEISPSGFFEGAWDGDLGSLGFDNAVMTGSGAKRVEDGLLVVASSHTLDRLVCLQKDDVLYMSNSLPFLLAKSGEVLDDKFYFYDSYFASIRYGLRKVERTIPLRAGNEVRFFYGCNVLLDRDGELHPRAKPQSPEFSNYVEYRAYLNQAVSRIAQNAGDERRRTRYKPIATLSRGYDSPAALVVAMGIGCRTAVTFRNSRGAETDEDCGTPIGRALGMQVLEFGRLDYRSRSNFPEIENSGGPNEFLSFEVALEGGLVFTGFHGDKVWDKNCDKVSTDLVRGDASGGSLTEYRLRVGFCHLPVPFIGADRHPALYVIANSEEMRPWSLGTFYDRPVARRIVEEAGISRDAFGQKKRAAGVVVDSEGIGDTMSTQSKADFESFCRGRWSYRARLNAFALKMVKGFSQGNRQALAAVRRIGHATGVPLPDVPYVVPHRLDMLSNGYVGMESLLFHWGIEKLVDRYRNGLASVGSKGDCNTESL